MKTFSPLASPYLCTSGSRAVNWLNRESGIGNSPSHVSPVHPDVVFLAKMSEPIHRGSYLDVLVGSLPALNDRKHQIDDTAGPRYTKQFMQSLSIVDMFQDMRANDGVERRYQANRSSRYPAGDHCRSEQGALGLYSSANQLQNSSERRLRRKMQKLLPEDGRNSGRIQFQKSMSLERPAGFTLGINPWRKAKDREIELGVPTGMPASFANKGFVQA